MPVTDLIRVQIGEEATWGTCVAATKKLMGVTDASVNIMDVVHHTEKGGWYHPSGLVAEVSQMGKGSVAMDLTYQDVVVPLDNFFDEVGTHATTATAYTWAYDAPSDTTVAPNFLTIEFGAPSAEYECCGVLFTELNISGEAGGVWVGDFPFICQDVATGSMATGTGDLADRAVDLIRMADTEIYIDTWSGTIGTTVKNNQLISFELHVEAGRHLKMFAGAVVADDWGDAQWSGTLTTVLEYEADAKAIVDALLTPGLVQRMIRIQADPAAGVNVATIDFYGTLIDGATLFEDRDGNVTVSLTWEGTYNDTDSAWFGVDVTNTVKSI